MKNYIKVGYLALLGLIFAPKVLAAEPVIDWPVTVDFNTDILTNAATFIELFADPIMLIVAVLCATIGIGAVIGYLKH